MKVLWLASLYPSVLFPYDGDFIQRHAHAVAMFSEIELIYVVKDGDGIITRDVKVVEKKSGQLTEKIIYYRPGSTSIKLIDRFLSALKYRKVFRSALRSYFADNGLPEFIHLHMAMKAGLVARWAKRRYAVPYILTEHWGAFLPEAKPNLTDHNFLFRYYAKKIVEEAHTCSFVSQYFRNQMVKLFRIRNSLVIPNVVDTRIFHPAPEKQEDIVRFIHVSAMIYQKNTEAILEAMLQLRSPQRVRLDLYGHVHESIQCLIADRGLEGQVFLRGEVPQDVLANAMRESDALILYSRFETFGCVLIEANACGIPVIVSDLEVFHEIVNEGVNGMFVAGEAPLLLAKKLDQFIEQKNTFDANRIAEAAAARYNFEKVGAQFIELYQNVNQ